MQIACSEVHSSKKSVIETTIASIHRLSLVTQVLYVKSLKKSGQMQPQSERFRLGWVRLGYWLPVVWRFRI